MKILAILSISFAAFTSGNAPQLPADLDAIQTNSHIEGLVAVAPLSLGTGHNLLLEPGVRATRANDTVNFATYGHSRMELIAGTEKFFLTSPITARITDAGLDFGAGRVFNATALTLRRDVQDDTDNNLKSMQESAKKLKAKNDATPPKSKLKSRVRWLYGNNPFPTAEAFNTIAIQQLTHLSPVGF
jgi:hypothetical protein